MSETAEKDFIEQFCQTFAMYSYGNQLYGRICAHILLGQKLRNIKIYFGPFYIDPRISLFLVQASGTGKSIVWDYIRGVAEKSGIKVDDIDEATDAALIGTEEEEEEIDPETKVKTTKHNVIKGKLANSDLLHYDEGQLLVKRGMHSQNTLAWFQKALNPIGSGQNICKKYMAHAEIEVRPTCSLLITSHEISRLLEAVLEVGFFQRIILYPRYIPIPERKNNELLRAGRFGKRSFTEIDIETLAELLSKIGKKYEGYELKVDERVYPVMKSKITDLYKFISTAHERVREIMATFVPRYNNLIYIFALHHCCVNMKDIIDIEDIKYGSKLAMFLFKEVMSWVEENINLIRLSSKETAYLKMAYLLFKTMGHNKEGYVMKFSFLKRCHEEWHISVNTINRFLDKFRGFGKVKEMDKNGTTYIKIEI